MDLEQVRQDFAEGKMISKCTWALVLQATVEMEDSLQKLSRASGIVCELLPANAVLAEVDKEASDCLGRVASL